MRPPAALKTDGPFCGPFPIFRTLLEFSAFNLHSKPVDDIWMPPIINEVYNHSSSSAVQVDRYLTSAWRLPYNAISLDSSKKLRKIYYILRLNIWKYTKEAWNADWVNCQNYRGNNL